MKLYLIRHGIAEERTIQKQDSQRQLIEKGCQKTEKVAQWLNNLGINFDSILTSPLIRAKQTAEILQKAGLSNKIEELPTLAPEGNIKDWLNWFQNSVYNESENNLALVGHQPNLGNWAEMLLWGSSSNKIIVKKSGIIGLELPQSINPMGNSELFLLTCPKWLFSSNDDN